MKWKLNGESVSISTQQTTKSCGNGGGCGTRSYETRSCGNGGGSGCGSLNLRKAS